MGCGQSDPLIILNIYIRKETVFKSSCANICFQNLENKYQINPKKMEKVVINENKGVLLTRM